MSYTISENNFGKYKTVKLEGINASVEIALEGATLLSYNIPFNGMNIIDGFASPEEFEAARGARSWIMAPFANRIKDGKYSFNGKEYHLKPIPPRTEVIHGFTSYENFSIKHKTVEPEFAKVILECNSIRKGKYEGYPFDINIFVEYTLSEGSLNIKVTAENMGEEDAPFFTGWHPYFRTSLDEGIEHLILNIDAESIIKVDDNFIPLEDENAFTEVDKSGLDFSSDRSVEERRINGKEINHCFANLKLNDEGLAQASVYDPKNGLKILVYQKGGVTLVFTGDSLAQRARKSIAIEPMQAVTNSFNRDDFKEVILIKPGKASQFEFGVSYEVSEISNTNKD